MRTRSGDQPRLILGKPVYMLETEPFNKQSGFVHKLLCDGPTFSAGTACAYSCRYCYVESMVLKQPGVRMILRQSGCTFDNVVIRRQQVLQRLARALTVPRISDASLSCDHILPPELIHRWGLTGEWSVAGRATLFVGPTFKSKVVFGSPLVDVAATPELAMETVEICEMLLRLSSYQIRLLSKSPLLAKIVATELVQRLPIEAKERIIFGLSTGTFDDQVALAIEPVPLVSRRLEALQWLQREGFRTYGMICPILPQADPDRYAEIAMGAIGAENCEAVWAEPLNFRLRAKPGNNNGDHTEFTARDSFGDTLAALSKLNDQSWAMRFQKVAEDDVAWEEYCRVTFEALRKAIPKATPLHWMQYPRNFAAIREYWQHHDGRDALLLGAVATLWRKKTEKKPCFGGRDDCHSLVFSTANGANPKPDKSSKCNMNQLESENRALKKLVCMLKKQVTPEVLEEIASEIEAETQTGDEALRLLGQASGGAETAASSNLILTPGKKAWLTMRSRYTQEEIRERARQAAKKAKITRAKRYGLDSPEAAQ